MASAIAFLLVTVVFAPTRVSANTDSGWGSPMVLSTDPSYDAFNPSVAIGGDGAAIVVWESNNIWSSRFVPGVGWDNPVIIGSLGSSPSRPRVAMDASGNAIAVWQGFDGIASSIIANRFTPSAGWGTDVLIESLDGPAYQPEVAMDPGGNATVVWYQDDGTGSYNASANRYAAGVGWVGQAFLAGFPGNVLRVRPAASLDGSAIAVWQQFDGVTNSIFANRFVPGTGWTGPTLLESTDQTAAFPWVAMDSAGNAMAVWSQYDGVVDSSFAARYSVGVGWSPAESIGTSTGNAQEQRIAMNRAGHAVAAWQQFDPGDNNLVVNRYVPGTGWTGDVVVDTRLDYAYAPFVAIDEDGNAIVVWIQSDGVADSVFGNRYVVGVGWTGTVLLERFADGAEFPRVAVDARGDAIAVWDQYDSTQALNSVRVNRYARDNVPPSLVVSSPTEGFLGTPSVTISGTTEPGATVTINGTPVAVGGTGAFSRTVTLPDGPHTFTIVARDSEGNANVQTVRVTVDTTAPTLTLTAPSSGANVEVPTVNVAGTTDPDARLVVNGIVVDVSLSGAFSFQLALNEGSNTIVATASDQLGRSTSVTRTVTYTNPAHALEQELNVANGNLSGLTILVYVLEGLLAVLVVVAIAEFVMYQRLSRKIAKPPGPPGGGTEEP